MIESLPEKSNHRFSADVVPNSGHFYWSLSSSKKWTKMFFPPKSFVLGNWIRSPSRSLHRWFGQKCGGIAHFGAVNREEIEDPGVYCFAVLVPALCARRRVDHFRPFQLSGVQVDGCFKTGVGSLQKVLLSREFRADVNKIFCIKLLRLWHHVRTKTEIV